MSDFIRSRVDAFKYAFSGWWYVIRTQRNAWIHAVASLLVIALSLYLQLDRYDWVFIFIAIAFVWTAEFLNTAIELVVDLSIQEHHPLAKASKDVGAAAVLIAAITAVIIGVIILGPPFLEKLRGIF